MNSTVKKFIAREGLVIVGLILVSILYISAFGILAGNTDKIYDSWMSENNISRNYSLTDRATLYYIDGKSERDNLTKIEKLKVAKAELLRRKTRRLSDRQMLGLAIPFVVYPYG